MRDRLDANSSHRDNGRELEAAGKAAQMRDVRAVFENRSPRIIGHVVQVQTAVMVPLLKGDQGELRVLFERRAATLRRQPGEVAFPGGHFESVDETVRDTAVRETCEELGISSETIEYIGELDTLVAWSGLIVHPFLGYLTEPHRLRPNKDEVDAVFSIALADLLNTTPRTFDMQLQVQPAEDFPFHLIPHGKNYPWRTTQSRQWFYEVDGHVIWGLTARILSNFLDIIKTS